MQQNWWKLIIYLGNIEPMKSISLFLLLAALAVGVIGCPEGCLCQDSNVCAICDQGFINLNIDPNYPVKCSPCSQDCLQCIIRVEDIMEDSIDYWTAAIDAAVTQITGGGEDPADYGVPQQIVPEDMEEQDYIVWGKQFLIVKTIETIKGQSLNTDLIINSFQIYNALRVNAQNEDVSTQPNQIRTFINQFTASAFTTEQAMQKLRLTVNTYSTCDECLPKNVLNPDTGTPENMICINDPFCTMPGCNECEGTQDLWFGELQGNYNQQLHMEMAVCVDCGEGKFSDGKACFTCPAGCTLCRLNLDSVWQTVGWFWASTMPRLATYVTGMGQDPSNLPTFDPETQTYTERRAWILVSLTAFASSMVQGDPNAGYLAAISLYPSLVSQSNPATQISLITAAINNFQNLMVFTDQMILSFYGQYLGDLTTCDRCAQGLNRNSMGQCSPCPAGKYNTNQDPSGTPQCANCPSNCDVCSFDEELNQATCDKCKSGFGFTPESNWNNCGSCPNNCLDCQAQNTECFRCQPSYFPEFNNETNVTECLDDQWCFEGCAECEGSSEAYYSEVILGNPLTPSQLESIVFCNICVPGKFNTGTVCYNCPAGCLQCELSQEHLWGDVTDFWQEALEATQDYLDSISDTTTILPTFNSEIEQIDIRILWEQLYLISQRILDLNEEEFTDQEMTDYIVAAYTAMSTAYGIQAELAAATEILNQFTEVTHTVEQVERLYAQVLGDYTYCIDCREGYNMNIYGQCQACPRGQYDANALGTRPPSCQICPNGCAECSMRPEGVFCQRCFLDWTRNPEDGSCFLCNQKCSVCRGDPDNCLECRPSYLHIVEGDTQTCVEDEYCGRNCLRCNGTAAIYEDQAGGFETPPQTIESLVVCDQCIEGAFPFGIGCYGCELGCISCSLDQSTLWAEVSGFWNATLQQVIATLQAAGQDASGVPTVTSSLSDPVEQRMWIQLYAFYNVVAEATQLSDSDIIQATFDMPAALATIFDPSEELEFFTQRYNTLTGDQKEPEQIQGLFRDFLVDYTVCDECFEGYQINGANECIACPIPGTFNANPDPRGIPNCRPCPEDCADCEVRDGRPFCVDCGGQTILNTEGGYCSQCNPKCSGCDQNPDDCVQCVQPYILQEDPNDPSITYCVRNNYCPQGCATCSGMDSLPANPTQEQIFTTVVCQQCMDGLYLVGNTCKICPFGAETCHLDIDTLKTDVANFWVPKLQAVTTYLTSQGEDTSEVPVFVPDDATDIQWMVWIKCYFITQYMLELDDGVHTELEVILSAEPLYDYLINNPLSIDQMHVIAGFLNSFDGIDINVQILNLKYNEALQEYVIADTCDDEFFLDTSDDTCGRCPAECTDCDENGDCSGCKAGFWLDTATCVPCHTSCKTCTAGTSSDCDSCRLPRTLASGQCVRCNEPCRTCDSSDTSVCVTCKSPYSLEPTVSGVCYMCDDARCKQCDSSDQSICEVCMDGLNLIEGICEECPLFCTSCATDADTTDDIPAECYQCQDGYASVDGTCVQCGRGCRKCSDQDASICEECHPGNYLDPEEQRCVRCEFGCDECDENGCLTFEAGIVQYMGEVVVECDLGCESCDPTDPRSCNECLDKFALDDVRFICIPCGPGCDECTYNSGTDVITCSSCRDGTYPSAGSCLPCGEGCSVCTNDITCSDCRRGYNEVGGLCVKNCDRGCAQCDPSDTTVCQVAKAGYALTTDSTVVKCSRHCSGSCDPEDVTSCSSCADGFMMVGDRCQKCPEGELTCNQAGALSCIEGYELATITVRGSDVDVCELECVYPCQECDGAICEDCAYGFKIQNGACVFDEDEVCDNNGQCEFCPMKTYKNVDDYCEPCGTTNCLICQSNDCTICEEGFYLDDSADPVVCQACPSQCKSCYDAETCEKCAPGFYKEVISYDQGAADAVFSDDCLQCDQNCKTCFLESFKCQSCHDGYRLTGSNRCIGRYTVEMKLVLDIDYDSFLSNRMTQELLEVFAAFMGIDLDNLDIVSLKRGSVAVGLSGSFSSASTASTASSIDPSTAAASSSGSSFPVIFSSVGVYYDDEELEDSNEEEDKAATASKVGIIVGVVVGVVVLGAVIGFVAYKMCWAKKTSHTNEIADEQSNIQVFDRNNDQQNNFAQREGDDTGLVNFKANYQ